MGLQPISREHSDHILDFEDWKAGGERFKVIFQPIRMCCVESILKSLVVLIVFDL